MAEATQEGKNVQAFLHVIRWAEFFPSGDRQSDYTTMFGGGQFTSTSDHPAQVEHEMGLHLHCRGGLYDPRNHLG